MTTSAMRRFAALQRVQRRRFPTPAERRRALAPKTAGGPSVDRGKWRGPPRRIRGVEPLDAAWVRSRRTPYWVQLSRRCHSDAMTTSRTPLARVALISNGLVWFGLSLMLFAIAGEQMYAAFTGRWFNVLGWFLLVAVATGLAVIGVIENRNVGAGKKRTPRSRSHG